jgi:predicted Zn-dependent protease
LKEGKLNKLKKATARLEEALARVGRAKRGNIMRARFLLEQARTEHLKQELKAELKEKKK